jgi:hypothetical protein
MARTGLQAGNATPACLLRPSAARGDRERRLDAARSLDLSRSIAVQTSGLPMTIIVANIVASLGAPGRDDDPGSTQCNVTSIPLQPRVRRHASICTPARGGSQCLTARQAPGRAISPEAEAVTWCCWASATIPRNPPIRRVVRGADEGAASRIRRSDLPHSSARKKERTKEVAGERARSPRVPCWLMRPFSRTTMCRTSRATSLGSWATYSTGSARSRKSRVRRLRISSLVTTSRLVRGSSSRSATGSSTRARAMATRCRSPPESSWGRRSALP